MEKGITVAGNIMVDTIKYIDGFPRPGMLANIHGLDRSVGGVLGNTIVDLAIIDPSMRLKAMGRVGEDENGQFSCDHLKSYGIETDGIEVAKGETTSFTDVMQDRLANQRTFFCYGGAIDGFVYDSIDFDSIDTDIFHLGYALLLAGMDSPDPEYGTVMAKTLAKVQSMGIKTSIDIVSEDSPRAGDIVRHSVKYCDYFIVNEEEAAFTTGIPARDSEGKLIRANIKPILEDLFERGVKDLAVIHCPEGGFAMDASGKYHEQPSLTLPKGFIVGSVGAGDAFCAGMLYGIYHGLDPKEAMRIGNGAAAACLRGSGGTNTMCGIDEIQELIKTLE